MSIEQDREYYILNQFAMAPGQSLKKIPGSKANPKGLDLDGPAKKTLESGLISRQFISIEGKGKEKSYVLTLLGADYLKTLKVWPLPPEVDAKFKAFVFLNLLASSDETLSVKQIKSILSPTMASALSTPKAAVGTALNAMAAEQFLQEADRDGDSADEREAFRLTDAGKRALASQKQHVDAQFKLSGAAINRLVECFGNQPPSLSTAESVQNRIGLEMSDGAALTDDDLIREANKLMTSHPNGLLPIYELRRNIRQKFGGRAAGIDEFDKRLKRMWGERVDLISIVDLDSYTRDQLNDGIQGRGELFFYLRNLR